MSRRCLRSMRDPDRCVIMQCTKSRHYASLFSAHGPARELSCTSRMERRRAVAIEGVALDQYAINARLIMTRSFQCSIFTQGCLSNSELPFSIILIPVGLAHLHDISTNEAIPKCA